MPPEEPQDLLDRLRSVVEASSPRGRWLILMHDNPDPDAMAAAAGLALLLRSHFGRRVTIAYGGLIGRAENRAMLSVLGIRASHVRHLKWTNYRHFALVDSQPRTGNNQLPDKILPEIVIDHHPTRRVTLQVPFSDIRTDYGASATIVAEYLAAAGIDIPRKLATAFIYAIRTETQDFRRDFTRADKDLHDSLLPNADNRALARIQRPRLPLSYFETTHRALERLLSVETLVVTHLEEVDQPDIVPEIADLLLRMEGKTWALCTGAFEGRLYLSVRTSNPRADAGRLMRRLIGRRGKGGGHGMTAGGWVALEAAPDSPERHQVAERLATYLGRRLAVLLKKNPDRLQPVLPD
jgi:nanoRNase/pAp phosphatase (c-di-AMP/oligoRNAs hydrolase)